MRIAGTEMAFPAHLPHQMGIAWGLFSKSIELQEIPIKDRLHGVNFEISRIAGSGPLTADCMG